MTHVKVRAEIGRERDSQELILEKVRDFEALIIDAMAVNFVKAHLLSENAQTGMSRMAHRSFMTPAVGGTSAT